LIPTLFQSYKKVERADVGVKNWYASCDQEDLFLSVLVVGEIRQGIERLKRRDPAQAERLEQRLADVLTLMQGRILAVSENIAQRWGIINSPDPLPVIDSLLAATALEYGLTLVTRNVRDVKRCGVSLLNPFADPHTEVSPSQV
jgi:predicted nucleic acid-binding protein